MGSKDRVVGHGFRATASTTLNESGHFQVDAIERQLAHPERKRIRAAYHRAEYVAERREMMQWRADLPTAMTAGAQVIPLPPTSVRAALGLILRPGHMGIAQQSAAVFR